MTVFQEYINLCGTKTTKSYPHSISKFFEVGKIEDLVPIDRTGKKISMKQARKLAKKILVIAEKQRMGR